LKRISLRHFNQHPPVDRHASLGLLCPVAAYRRRTIRKAAMNEIYRGHEIVVAEGSPKCAVIVESETGIELPTKVTALPDEGEHAYLGRARQLIDLYLDTLAADFTVAARQ
jgi:hypothetical protein